MSPGFMATRLILLAASLAQAVSAASLSASRLYDDLRSRLSPAAEVFSSGEESFSNVTVRWQNIGSPQLNAVVIAAKDSDVAETVSNDLDTIGRHWTLSVIGPICAIKGAEFLRFHWRSR